VRPLRYFAGGVRARLDRYVSRRARAVALLGVAAVCAGLAASIVSGYARDVRAQVGPLAPVLVARVKIPRGRLFTPATVGRYLSERRVPARFAPPRSFRSIRDAVGLRALTSIPAGSYLDEGVLGSSPDNEAPHSGSRRPSGRVVEVPVEGAGALESELRPGARVDVLITSERGSGVPRTYLALQRIELAGLRPGASAAGGGNEGAKSLVSLRVTLRQAVLLTAAQNFARELRVVTRAPGDEELLSPTAVSAQDLHP
jgi:pilus assembly protein CpaB